MFIFQSAIVRGLGKDDIAVAKPQKNVDLQKFLPKMNSEYSVAYKELNNFLYSLTQYEIYRGAKASPDGKTYGLKDLQDQLAVLRFYTQTSEVLKDNAEFVSLLGRLSYGLGVLTPGSEANKAYLTYLNPPKKEGFLTGVKAEKGRVTLEDKIGKDSEGGLSIALNTRRDAVLARVTVDADLAKNSLLQASLVAGATAAFQAKDTQTAKDLYSILSEVRGEGAMGLAFAPTSLFGQVEREMSAGNFADAGKKSRQLLENIAYAPSDGQMKSLTLKDYGLTAKAYEADVGEVLMAIAQGAPFSGSLWLTYNTGAQIYKAATVESGKGLEWAKAAGYAALTAGSWLADIYLLGKASGGKYTWKNFWSNRSENIATMLRNPASKGETGEVGWESIDAVFLRAERSLANINRANRAVKTEVNAGVESRIEIPLGYGSVAEPERELSRVEKIRIVTSANEEATGINKAVTGANNSASQSVSLFNVEKNMIKNREVIKLTEAKIAGDFKKNLVAEGVDPAKLEGFDLNALAKLKPRQKVRVDIDDRIYVVEGGVNRIKVSRLNLKSSDVEKIQKLNGTAESGDLTTAGMADGLETQGKVSSKIEGGKSMVFGRDYDAQTLQWEKNLRNAQNLRYKESGLRQNSYDDLMKKLDLPKPEDAIKAEKPTRQTAREIFKTDQQSRREKIAELKTDREIYVGSAKSPLKKAFGRIGYPVAIGLTNAERYPVYKAKEGVNAVRDLFGTKLDIYTALVAVNVIGRVTTKYLAFGFDMDPEKGISSPTAKLLWKKSEPKNEVVTPPAASGKAAAPEAPVEKEKAKDLLPWQHEFNNVVSLMQSADESAPKDTIIARLNAYMNQIDLTSKSDSIKAETLSKWAQNLPAELQKKEYGW